MEQTKEKRVSKSVAENRRRLEAIFGGSFDMVMRPLVATSGQAILVVFSDGLVNKTVVAEDIVRPFLGYSFVRGEFCPQELESIRRQLLSAVDIKPEPLLEQAAGRCLQGDTAVFIEGFDRALIIQTRGWQSRGISPPTSQQSVRGPKEAFTETLLFNVAMLRRKIRSPRLKLRMLQMGATSRTDVCVAYVEGAAKEELICEVCRRIGAAEAAYVLESGHVEQLVEDAPGSLFATVGNSEKPDVVAA
ncbi:MAG: spore germination protein, partial [Christensenellaceae bacterium]|nr:spore germination protein [Christensenellaceae bacterium]